MSYATIKTNTYAVNWGGGTSNLGLRLYWEQRNPSIANNTSEIHWELAGFESSGSQNGYVNARNIKVTIAGADRYINAGPVKVRHGTVLASGSFTFSHGDDGVGFTAGAIEAGFATGSINVSGWDWIALDTIARASQPSITWPDATQNVGDMGTKITIHMNRKSTAFTHTVRYSFGNVSGTIATGVGDSVEWEIPTDLANQIPNASSGTGTISVDTYKGSELVGTKSAQFAAAVPSSIVPSIPAPEVTEAVSGLADKFGGFVQYKSKLNVVSRPSGAKGSTIKSCQVKVNGKTYSGLSITTDAITESGIVKVTVTVKDSRGRTATATKNVTILAYENPSIASFAAKRCTSDGTLNDSGTCMKVIMKFSISSVNGKNNHIFSVDYREMGTSSWMTAWSGTATYSYDSSAVVSGVTLNVSKGYEVRLTIADYFMSTTANDIVQSSFRLVNFSADGKGIAFGKFSEGPEFDVGMPAKFRKSVTLGDSSADVHQVNGFLVMNTGNIYTANGRGYFSRSNADSGTKDMSLIECNSSNHTVVGYGGYSNGIGETHIMGKVVKLISKDTDGVYINGYWPICGKYANGYAGMLVNTTDDSSWIRTTSNGLIPYKSGGASSLGTSGWPFSNIYGNNIYAPTKLTAGAIDTSGGIRLGYGSATYGWMDFYVGTTMCASLYLNKSNNNGLVIRSQKSSNVEVLPSYGDGNGNLAVTGSVVYSNSCFQFSSRKYKNNIEDISGEDADKLLMLNPVTFDYKNTGVHSSGLIAEDTEPYFPGLIMYEKGEINGLNYIGLIPYIIKKMQMQQEEIETIKRNAG